MQSLNRRLIIASIAAQRAIRDEAMNHARRARLSIEPDPSGFVRVARHANRWIVLGLKKLRGEQLKLQF